MLENFTDEEIEELLDTGSFYLDVPGGSNRWIEKQSAYDLQGNITGSVYQYRVRFGEPPIPYRKLSGLLFCEYLSFDDIRAKWRYHGVLLDSPRFQEKLVK